MKCVLALVLAALTSVAFGERIELKTEAASCVLETRGARVISYKTARQGEILWNDDPVQLDASAWAHGGIPLCWPWFSRDAEGKFHGFAWKRDFKVVSRAASSARSELVLFLETPEATLTYTVLLRDKSLKLTLETRNVSRKPFAFSAALHPYFKVGERDRTWLSGVRDAPFAIKSALDGCVPGPKGSCKVFRLADKVLDRTLSLYADNADGVCTWNPGADYSTVPGKLPPNAGREYVCVEPTVGYPGKIVLAPGADHSFSYEIRPRVGAAVTGFAGRDARYPDAAEKAFRLPFRALFIGAHPDDAEYDFGAAAAKLVAAGAEVSFVSVCNGDNGHQTMEPAALAARRYRETQASAKTYGIERYIVMGEHDCRVEPTVELRQRVTRLIREFEPNMIVTHRICDYHADHRATGQVVQDSMYLVGVPLFAPETPVPELLPFAMYAGDPFTVPREIRPDLVVDGEDVLDTVAKALACHESQLFEWLPPEYGVDPATIPATPEAREAFVKKYAMMDLKSDGKQHRALVTKLFGGEDVRCINVFELCEYSRQPTAKERAFLAKLPGARWTK